MNTDSRGGMIMGKITRIEYDHATGVFRIMELTEGDACEYQTKDIWQVIGRIQSLVCDASKERYWSREGAKG